VTVVDQQAWNEPSYHDEIHCSCGQTFASTSQWNAHNKALGFGQSHSYSVYTTVTYTYHDAVTHTEDQGHYVTVTTGYQCSSCGATR
jgi:hypothetical protein